MGNSEIHQVSDLEPPRNASLALGYCLQNECKAFEKGLMGRQNRTPTIVVVWLVLLASIFSLRWVRIDPLPQHL
jgi:hypothetical protein